MTGLKTIWPPSRSAGGFVDRRWRCSKDLRTAFAASSSCCATEESNQPMQSAASCPRDPEFQLP